MQPTSPQLKDWGQGMAEASRPPEGTGELGREQVLGRIEKNDPPATTAPSGSGRWWELQSHSCPTLVRNCWEHLYLKPDSARNSGK